MAKTPTVSKKIDQNTLTQAELNEVIAVLKNNSFSAEYKLHHLEAIILPKEAANEG